MEDNNNEKIESFERMLSNVRKAQRKYSKYSQDKVDAIFKAVALAADKAAYSLAKEAVLETGMGNVEDKLIKNKYAAEFIYDQYKDSKTAGVIEEKGSYLKIAEPLGVLGAVVPTTNPTSTAIFKILLALKTRNAIIFSPHPRAKKCTIDAIRTCYRAAVEAGAPRNIIGWIEEPSVETSKLLMKECDCTLATGGPGMVISAYSSGKPALGVGPGNVPVVIDSSADLDMAAASIIHSKTFDNGTICASEQNCIVIRKVYDSFKDALIQHGAYIIPKDDMDKVRKAIMIPSKANPNACSVNPSVVGKTAVEIANIAGIDCPRYAKILVGEIEEFNPDEGFCKEKLSPVLSLIPANSFNKAMDIAENVAEHGGHGHTAVLYVDRDQSSKIEAFGLKLETCRILVNMPSSQGAIGGIYTSSIAPSLTLGCGSWGGNSIDENLGVDNLLNIKTVAIRKIKKNNMDYPYKIIDAKNLFKGGIKAIEKNYKKGVLPLIANKSFEDQSKEFVDRLEKEGFVVKPFFLADEDFESISKAQEIGREINGLSNIELIVGCCHGSEAYFVKLVRLFTLDPTIDIHDLAMPCISTEKRIVSYPKCDVDLMFIPLDEFDFAPTSNDILVRDGDRMLHLVDDSIYPQYICVKDDEQVDENEYKQNDVYTMFVLSRIMTAYTSIHSEDYLLLKAECEDMLSEILTDESEYGSDRSFDSLGIDASLLYSKAGGGLIDALSNAIAGMFHKSHMDVEAIIFTKVFGFMIDGYRKMGTANCYTTPVIYERLNRVGYFLGMNNVPDPYAKDKMYEYGAFVTLDNLKAIKDERKIGNDLSSIGIDVSDLKRNARKIALLAFEDQSLMSSPVYPTIEDLTKLIKKL